MRAGVFFVALFLVCSKGLFAKTLDGLVLTGLDTIRFGQTYREYGFDFVHSEKCTTVNVNDPCIQHLKWFWYGFNKKYCIAALSSDGANGYGRAIPYGKINLDSIGWAPADSIFNRYSFWADSIPPDSFASRIGNVYVLRMGIDRRNNTIYFGKIKIIDIIPRNLANHEADLVFLWVYNRNNFRDLPTQGLDTFHLDSVPTMINRDISAKVSVIGFAPGSRGFKVVGNRFVLPEGATSTFVMLYSVRGEYLGTLPVTPGGVITIPKEKLGNQPVVLQIK